MTSTKSGLRELRRRAMLTQRELADRLGVDQRRIHEWETGSVTPRPANQRRLCEALGVTGAELLAALEGVGEPEGKAAA